MAQRIARVVWFDIYGEDDWHEGTPVKLYKLEAIGRVWEERIDGIKFLVIAPHNSIDNAQRFYDLKIPKRNVLSIEYWEGSKKFDPVCEAGPKTKEKAA